MNFFAHGFRFLEDPYFLAGTAVPDWLSSCDRKTRTPPKKARRYVDDEDPQIAAVAAGIVRHHEDDAWFHQNRAFNELNLQFARRIRETLGADDTLRATFVGHVLVELLLDAVLTVENPGQLDAYYAALSRVDPVRVQQAVNRIAFRPTEVLTLGIAAFRAERYLYDYLDNEELLGRLNNVMRRVRLPPLPLQLRGFLQEARIQVFDRKQELLEPS